MSRTINFWELCAREIGNLPPEWRWHTLSAVGKFPTYQGTMVSGGVTHAVISRGPNKGRPNWRKRDKEADAEIFVSNEAFSARLLRYEAETGNCAKCSGTGEVFSGWNKDTGIRLRPCHACSGTGKAGRKIDESAA